jgi:hypothetical protein
MRAVGKTMTPGRPRTLMQAHEELVRIRPSRDASLTVWLEYYQDSVLLYELIAKVDPAGWCGNAARPHQLYDRRRRRSGISGYQPIRFCAVHPSQE